MPSPVPGFIIDKVIGQGSSSVVYRAFRAGSDRPVALKVLRAEVDPARARRELELLEAIQLACVPRLLDFGIQDGRLYIAEEYIEGTHLHDYAAKLDRRSRVHLLADVSDAVQSLHERGVIHRDLKPANIMVRPGRNGTTSIVIVDLGLAMDTAQPGGQTLTQFGTPLGTPAFMAPEQARGERSRISTRSDVYSLGAIGFLLLTGHTPHDTSTSVHEAVRRVALDAPREPRSLDETTPIALSAVLTKACHRDPTRRYASASELANDLRCWLRGDPVSASPPGAWLRLARWVFQHPMPAAAAIGAIVVFCSILGTYIAVFHSLRSSPDRITISEDRQVAHLVSVSGHEMNEWRTDVPNGISTFGMFSRPSQFGGGRVVLGVIATTSNEPWDRRLTQWLPSDPTRPAWIAANGPPDLVPPRFHTPGAGENQRSKHFIVSRFIVADVLPNLPGDEIVAIQHDDAGSSLNAICVYDFSGACHFTAWHDGGIQDLRWIPRERVLMVAGLNQEVDWATILGQPDLPNSPGSKPNSAVMNWPIVVFAIRLEDSTVPFGWIHAPTLDRQARWSGSCPDHADPRTQVVLYKWMTPAAPAGTLKPIELTVPGEIARKDHEVSFVVEIEDTKDRFSWFVGPTGPPTPGPLSDGIKARGVDPFKIYSLADDPAPP